MDKSLKFHCTLLILALPLVGCGGGTPPVTLGASGLDPTTEKINGTERSHSWVVAGVDGQSATFDVTVLKTHSKTPLDLNSVKLKDTNLFFTLADLPNNQLRYAGNLTLDISPQSLPPLNATTGTRFIPYTAQANFGSTISYSSAAQVEVLRPYCEVQASPFSTLGMTFETPNGAAPTGGWPTVLFIHGGSLVSRNHVDMEAYTKSMRAQGYAVANMNYRMIDRNPTDSKTPYSTANLWNDPVADVKCAIRYLKENSRTLGVNTEKIGLVGHSSGANIAIQAATTEGSALQEYAEQGAPVRLDSSIGNYDTSVAALFVMDVTTDVYRGLKLVIKNSPFDADVKDLFKAVYGVDASTPDLKNHPTVVTASAITHVNAETNLPMLMEFSVKDPVLNTIDLPWWEHGCAMYNAVASKSTELQLNQTLIKEYRSINHNSFVLNKSTVTTVSGDMISFFNHYLMLTGSKPATGFDYNRCASLPVL